MSLREFVLMRLERAPRIGVGIREAVSACDASPEEVKVLFRELIRDGIAKPIALGNLKRIVSADETKRNASSGYRTPFRMIAGAGTIGGFGYLESESLLEIEFHRKKGGASLYRYFKVSPDVYQRFEEAMNGTDRARAFRMLIRDRFPYERVR